MVGNATGATAPKTPPHIVNSGPKLNSTPLAVGSAAISEHIDAVGVGIQDVCPWIARDVEDYNEGAVDKMLEELLYCCTDDSKPLPDKSTLLNDSLKAVLPICNEGNDAQIIKNHMVTLNIEPDMYQPFIKAANCALRRLSELDAPGLVPSKAEDDLENIIFHLNGPSLIYQTYQGEQSSRKPDVVIVPNASAMKAGKCEVDDIYESALKKAPKTTYNIPEAKKFMNYRRETDQAAGEPEPDATPLPASGAATSSRPDIECACCCYELAARHRMRSGRTNNKGDKKRSSVGLADGGRSSKKARKEPPKPHPVVQNAHFTRQSVISFVVENDIIYTWYFDRQGAIQCSGINFVQDLPRFMVLLLAMQRMSYAEWGYHTLPELVSSGEVRVDDKKIGVVDLKFNLMSDERITHFGLRGRATTVFPVESVALSALVPQLPHYNPHNPTDKLVAKLYWPEEERESEADILQKVYDIAKKDEEGKVIMRSGKMVIHHRDVSYSNLMVYETSDGRWIGVLNDFDLSSTRDTPSGQERTGTVPFMALDLLTKEAINGQVKHLYQHDAESFIWVLTWVCICYEDGAFIGKEVSGRWRDLALRLSPSIMWPELVPTVEDYVVFQTWLRKNILEAKILSPALLDSTVADLLKDTITQDISKQQEWFFSTKGHAYIETSL
ncbi:hypothetical protein EDB19DRAFT_1832147 [Suillus lakei]|nr:hypothetical protein EDB19DRAFT_1832147 [Suillus lakei]